MKKKVVISFFIAFFIFTNIFSISPQAVSFNINFEPKTESLFLLNLDKDIVVYEKDPHKKMYPAATTKIMTYIIVSEKVDDIDSTTVTIKPEILKKLLGTGSVSSISQASNTLTVRQLLHSLLIGSGNDAALILADFIGNGSIEGFVQMMNDKAESLGCYNTHFTNPHGLHNENHYTTAYDLATITKHALTLPSFAEISGTVTSKIMGEDIYPLVTTNLMIDPYRGGKYYYKYARGIKAGSTNEAGRCLVSTAANNGYTYLCVALGAPINDESGNKINDNYAMLDSKSLYEWAFSNLRIKQIVSQDKSLGEVKLKLSSNRDSILVYPIKNYSILLPKDVNTSSIDITLNTPETINAPIKNGQKVGTATLKYANAELTTIDIIAGEDVDANLFLLVIHYIVLVFTSIWFKILLALIILLIAIYFIAIIKYNKINRSRKKRNKRKKH